MLRSFVAVLAAATPCVAQVNFYGLGVPPEASSSQTTAVSADGRVVLGFRVIDERPGYQIVRWTAEGGSELIPPPPSMLGPIGNGLNADGSMIVGNGVINNRSNGFIWTRNAGYTLHPGLTFHGVSDDGNVLFGNQDNVGSPFRWSASAGRETLADAGTTIRASADGSVIIGRGSVNGYGWRWTQATGQVSLGAPPAGMDSASPTSLTPDGSTIVGFFSGASDPDVLQTAFRWTADNGYEVLPRIANADSIRAFDVSADARTIVGSAFFGSGDDRHELAVIWTPDGNVHVLSDYLESLGADFDGWILTESTGISDDGLTIIGNGFNPDGVADGWIVRIPAPTTALAFALLLPSRRRRR